MTIGVVSAEYYSTQTPTIPATGGPDHSLIVVVNAFETGSEPSVSGITLGSVGLIEADGQVFGGTGLWSLSWIYYLSAVSAGQTALNVSGSNLAITGTDGGVGVIEVDCPIVLDKSNHNSGNSVSASSGPTGILSSNEGIAVGGIAGFNLTDTAGFTDIETGDSLISYKVVSSDASLNLTASLQTAASWTGAIAAFRRGSKANNAGAFMGLLV